jgi:hypothetical protein
MNRFWEVIDRRRFWLMPSAPSRRSLSLRGTKGRFHQTNHIAVRKDHLKLSFRGAINLGLVASTANPGSIITAGAYFPASWL